jgi:hypothetical protein
MMIIFYCKVILSWLMWSGQCFYTSKYEEFLYSHFYFPDFSEPKIRGMIISIIWKEGVHDEKEIACFDFRFSYGIFIFGNIRPFS